MQLVQLIYASSIVNRVNPDEIDNILGKAREHNSKQYITGLLVFNRKYFMQVLEGGATQVNALYNKIAADSRHERVQLLGYNNLAMRDFANWSMAYCGDTGFLRNKILHYMSTDEFIPYNFTYQSAKRLMIELLEMNQ